MQASPTYHSQIGQDQFLYEKFFQGRTGGIFIEIGAFDGVTYSNTCFFERHLGWTGLCIEPLPSAFDALQKNRTARCYNCCVSDFEGVADFLDVDVLHESKMFSGLLENYDLRQVERIRSHVQSQRILQVQVRTLNGLLEENGLAHVDYCSIDTEGSELKILGSLDFSRFTFDYFSIENNYSDARCQRLMDANGFELIHVFGGYDQLYARRGILP
ncbi:MAG: FkbM family methyltransferase [Holophagaceae bacterium]|nr:FkbM family methyltransferase [Holophagaceae bacterium]